MWYSQFIWIFDILYTMFEMHDFILKNILKKRR